MSLHDILPLFDFGGEIRPQPVVATDFVYKISPPEIPECERLISSAAAFCAMCGNHLQFPFYI